MPRLSQSYPRGASYTEWVETGYKVELQESAAAPPCAPPAAPAQVRIGYLLSRYPAISHTFFLHEVLGLRARGLALETASINPPDRPLTQLPAAEAAEAKKTYYVKHGSRLGLLAAVTGTALRYPGVVFRGLRAIAGIRGLTLRRRGFWLLYLAEALLVGRWMRHHGLKHLHVHFGGAVASVGMLTAAAWRIPFSLTIHGPEELLNTESYQLREKVTAASFIFCISDFCRSQLCQLVAPEHWDKLRVVRLGVDPVLLTPVHRPTAAVGKRRLELACTGRLVAAKGHMILLEALLLLRERGVHLHTTLIGGGPEHGRLQAFVQAHELEEDVTFAGPLSHPQTLARLRRADLFALASFAEGVPVALMEAMSLGLPCVSTAIAGIPELIEHGVSGVLVAPAQAAQLADALEALASDVDLRHALGSAARRRIISRYNLPMNQELLAQQFETLTAAEARYTPGPGDGSTA